MASHQRLAHPHHELAHSLRGVMCNGVGGVEDEGVAGGHNLWGAGKGRGLGERQGLRFEERQGLKRSCRSKALYRMGHGVGSVEGTKA